MSLNRIDLQQTLAPLQWFVEGLILQGYINTIASLPGEGKTAILTGLAWQASRPNGMFLNRQVQHGTSIYVDYDAPGEGRTVRFWLDKHRKAVPDGDINNIIVLEPDMDTYGLAEVELNQLTEVAQEVNAKLILIDSFSTAFPSIDPIKLNQVQGPLWFLRRLAMETGAAVVIVDHLPKPISGEKAGMRGIIGSVAKSAQARGVHILSRIPRKDIQGRNVLRWDSTKMSYSVRPEPFGVELRFNDDAVFIELTDLPQGHTETRTEKAVRILQDYLEAHRGVVVTHQDLLELAMRDGDLRKRASADVIRIVKERFGSELASVTLSGVGNPQGYQLKLEQEGSLKPPASLHQLPTMPSSTKKPLLQQPLYKTSATASIDKAD